MKKLLKFLLNSYGVRLSERERIRVLMGDID